MAKRGRKTKKRTNKTVRLSIPKRLYFILSGIAGGNEQKLKKLNRLIRLIIEERLKVSTVAELSNLIESSRKKEEGEG